MKREARVGHNLKLPTEGPITPREREVIDLVMEGLVNKDIASRLEIEEVTVKRHFSNIFAKLGVKTRLQLAIHEYRAKNGPPA
jgi:DNA-binding NarL/FixJ family response regulator